LPNTPPQAAVERAREALRQLERSQATERKIGKLTRVAVGVVVLLALTGLIVHTFFEDSAPQVDSTTVALLAVALIAPFVSRLKALEVGGAKAEWQEGAAFSLKEILRVLSMQQEAISQLFDEVAARAATGNDAQPPISTAEPAVDQTIDRPWTLRRLLWVDDHPENNTYELESLRRVVDVVTVKSNDEAFTVIEQQEIDAVISDTGRDYDRPEQLPGGVRLQGDLRQRFPDKQLPLLYYTSTRSIQRYGADLEASGALVVTSLFSDLIRTLRQLEERFLEITARAAASNAGNLRERMSTREPDVVVELPNKQVIGIEIGSWLQRPQMSAFVERPNRLNAAIRRGEITHGIFLVRPEVLDDRRRLWAADQHIELVGPDELAEVLNKHATSPIPPARTIRAD
jgi:CheY-like chemotaxis protein